MEKLRTPFFVVAAICLVLAVMLESGSGFIIKPSIADADSLRGNTKDYQVELRKMDPKDLQRLTSRDKPPGLAIPQMALLEGLLLFTIALMGGSFILTDRVSGKIQGVLSLIVSLLVIIAAVLFILADVENLVLMLSLFLAPPFGTIAYLAIWGGFNRGGAEAILGATLFLKFAFCIALVLAQQRFLQMKGLMLLVGTSLLANLVVSFLHALVPVILVSITDAVAAIVVLILALIWAVAMFVGAAIAVVKAIF